MTVQPEPASIDRREAIRRITAALGGAVSTQTLVGLLAGCEAPGAGEPWAFRTLGSGQARTLDVAAEMIIPETDTPGASAARVPEFIDMMLSDFYAAADRARFLEQLTQLDERATELADASFADAAADVREQVLRSLDAEAYPDPAAEPEAHAALLRRLAEGDPPLMRTLKELVVSGYYTSEIGQTVELRVSPSGPFEADVPLDAIGRSWA